MVVILVFQNTNMPIIINLDVMLAKRKMKLQDLSDLVDIHISNMSLLRAGKVKGIKFSTLEAICTVLDCEITDILELKKAEKK